MTAFFLAALLLPFLCEGQAKAWRDGRPHRRSAYFYLLTPVTSLVVYAGAAALVGHPWFAFALWALVYVGLTIVSNLKLKVLGTPFVAHDFDNFRHLFIYPEFYVDYVGASRLIMVGVALAGGVLLSFATETSVAARLLPSWPGPLAYLALLGGYILLLMALIPLARKWVEKNVDRLGLAFDMNKDVERFGHFGLIPLYGLLLANGHDREALRQRFPERAAPTTDERPDIIALQAESYFDITRLHALLPEAAANSWQPLDALKAAGTTAGHLEVPAWGAYTMQSEFAFLSTIPNADLRVDCINPYMRLAAQPVATLASHLRSLGYRTICVHPARKEFFRRDTVIHNMGFDEFIGIEAFGPDARLGPYVSDRALGDHIEALIRDHHATSNKPLFLFAITIESHGPWEPGRLVDWMDEAPLVAAEPTGDHEFALYRHHMENALALFHRLGPGAETNRPRTLALYGDHQPALADLFEAHGFNDTRVDYLIWKSNGETTPVGDLAVDKLAEALLKTAGL